MEIYGKSKQIKRDFYTFEVSSMFSSEIFSVVRKLLSHENQI